MDAGPAIKRRKLNQAVNKPFKSPLKTSLNQDGTPHVGSPLASTSVKNASDHGVQASASRALHSGPFSTPLKHRPYATQSMPRGSLPLASSDSIGSKEIQDTLRQIRTLESSLMKTRQDIDTLDQALRLVASNKDAELNELAIKWRRAARQAAEEVFAGARDKVNHMGGMGAWRERQKEMATAFNQWNERQQGDDDEWEYDAEIRKEEKQDEGIEDDVSRADVVPE